MATTVLNFDAVADGSITTVLSTEMNSLATATDSSAGSAYDNRPSTSTGGYFMGQAQASLTFGTNPTAGSQAYLYGIFSVDGTNYAAANSTSARLLTTFPLRATTSAQTIDGVCEFAVPPSLIKFLVRTDAGQTLAASGNTIKVKFNRQQAN